jgi:hypothetical protein
MKFQSAQLPPDFGVLLPFALFIAAVWLTFFAFAWSSARKANRPAAKQAPLSAAVAAAPRAAAAVASLLTAVAAAPSAAAAVVAAASAAAAAAAPLPLALAAPLTPRQPTGQLFVCRGGADALAFAALCQALRARIAALRSGAHEPIYRDTLWRHIAAYRARLAAEAKRRFWEEQREGEGEGEGEREGAGPACLLRHSAAVSLALAGHLLEAGEAARDPGLCPLPQGAAAAAALHTPSSAATAELAIAGADRLALYTEPAASPLHAALAAGLPVQLSLNLFPSFFSSSSSNTQGPSALQGAPLWLLQARPRTAHNLCPSTDAPGPLGSHTFTVTDVLKGQGGQWYALAKAAGRPWLISAELLANEKSRTSLAVVVAQ